MTIRQVFGGFHHIFIRSSVPIPWNTSPACQSCTKERPLTVLTASADDRKQTRTSVPRRRNVRCNTRLETPSPRPKKADCEARSGVPTDIFDAYFRQSRQSDPQRCEGLSRRAAKTTTPSLRRCYKAGRDRNVKMHQFKRLRWACHESDSYHRSTLRSDRPSNASSCPIPLQ